MAAGGPTFHDMVRCLWFTLFCLCVCRLPASDIAIYARGEAYVLGATAPDLDRPDGRAFWRTFKAAVAEAAAWPGELPLINPPAWGKTLSAETQGMIQFRRSFPGGFFGHLSLCGLAPQTLYILTFNGNPELAGNALLPTPVPGLADERYYDFAFVETDANGDYDATLGVKLAPGDYAVRLYVKDTSDFKIVLYRDYFPFTVK